MSRWKLIMFVGLVVVSVSYTLPDTTSAQAAPVSREIKIQAQVLPTHTVIVDAQGVIQKIISNSTDSSTNITVYVGTVTTTNERAPTPELLIQYAAVMHFAPNRVGVVYQNTILPMASLLSATASHSTSRQTNPIALALISR